MGKNVFIYVLVMLLFVHVSIAEDWFSNNFDDVFGEIENLEFEDDEIELLDMPSWSSQRGGKILVNVDSFGAAGDGVADDTKVNIMILMVMKLVYKCVECLFMFCYVYIVRHFKVHGHKLVQQLNLCFWFLLVVLI